MAFLFSIVGDSNIRRHINKNSCRASPFVKACQVIHCGNLETFVPSLKSVRAESNVCLISCVSNFLSDAEGPSSVAHRVDPVLQDLCSALQSACSENPSRRYVVAPPMYRHSPMWYREGLSQILSLFSQVLTSEKPANLHLLPSFGSPDYDPDGVHLTPYAGMEFVLSLFDGAQSLIEGLSASSKEVSVKCVEANRVLEDRVVALEQDHRRLNRVVDDKIAIDAEMSDFLKNERFEEWFVIEGTERIPDEVVGKPWQDQAVRDVKHVLRLLMGKEMPVTFVSNATTRQPDAIVTYNVKMPSVAESKAIRTKFGSFFLGGRGDQRPTELKPYSIKNRVTPETKIRISVLKLLAKRYRDSNPGSKVQVIGYDPRPTIKITPPQDASDRRVKTFNYVEAVKALPVNLSLADVAPIVRRINPRLSGQIRSIFVILSDDQYHKRGPQPAPGGQPAAPSTESSSNGQSEAADQSETEPMDSRGASNPPPTQVNARRSQKRGASSALGAAPKK